MKLCNMIKFEITIKSLVCLLLFLISTKCSKKDIDDNEINVVSDVDSESSNSQQEITLSTEINDFIWKGLNQYYYWQSDVSNLEDSKATMESEYIIPLPSQINFPILEITTTKPRNTSIVEICTMQIRFIY